MHLFFVIGIDVNGVDINVVDINGVDFNCADLNGVDVNGVRVFLELRSLICLLNSLVSENNIYATIYEVTGVCCVQDDPDFGHQKSKIKVSRARTVEHHGEHPMVRTHS